MKPKPAPPAAPETEPAIAEVIGEATVNLAAATAHYLAARRQLKEARTTYDITMKLCGMDR